MRILTAGAPVLHRRVHRILQHAGPGLHRMDLRPEQLHAVYVERLPLRIDLAHEDLALHAEERRHRSRRHAVLSRAGLRDEPLLPHTLRQQGLADAVVDLVRAGVIQVLPLQVDPDAQIGGHPLRLIEQRRPPRIVPVQLLQLCQKGRIVFAGLVGLPHPVDLIHQCFRHILPAKDAKSSIHVRSPFIGPDSPVSSAGAACPGPVPA